jgi:hypothetical protein
VYTTYDEGDAFQFKTPDKLGWVRKGTEAEYFKLCFEQAQSYDTSRFVPDDVPAATEPVPESAKATIQKLANTGLVAEEAIF